MLFTPEQQRAGRKLPVFAAVFGVLQCSFFLSARASELTVIQSETVVIVQFTFQQDYGTNNTKLNGPMIVKRIMP